MTHDPGIKNAEHSKTSSHHRLCLSYMQPGHTLYTVSTQSPYMPAVEIMVGTREACCRSNVYAGYHNSSHDQKGRKIIIYNV